MTTEIDQKFRVLQIIYGALFASLFFYGGGLFLVSKNWDAASAKGFDNLEFLVAAVVALGIAASIPILKNILLGKIQPEWDATKKLKSFQVAHIVALAMAESVLFLGLMAAIILKNRMAIFPFFGFAILLFVVHAPRRALFDQCLRQN